MYIDNRGFTKIKILVTGEILDRYPVDAVDIVSSGFAEFVYPDQPAVTDKPIEVPVEIAIPAPDAVNDPVPVKRGRKSVVKEL